jgi:cysteine desulfuration protein SufE
MLPTTDEIIEDLEFFDDWEDRYKYIIDLGKGLAPMSEDLFTTERLVKGCQSNVWLDVSVDDERLKFLVSSDAIIVKGLLAVVMAAFDNKTPAQIIDFDIEKYFQVIDLEGHLSPTRGNGLRSIVAKIRAIAQAAS